MSSRSPYNSRVILVLPWLGAALGASALALSIALFVRLRTIPHNATVTRDFQGVLAQVEIQESRVSAVTRDFRQLESEVEDMLERATKKIQRANATRTNAVRAERNSNGAPGPGGVRDWDAEQLALENALRDGRAAWR